MMSVVMVAPAILAKTCEEFRQKLAVVLPLSNRIQIDIMDGKFVPNVTVGEDEIIDAKLLDAKTIEYHLMVDDPIAYMQKISRNIPKNNAIYVFHAEAVRKPEEVIKFCKANGLRVGMAINPDTSPAVLAKFADELEMVMFMTVYPGFSGQQYLAQVEEKIRGFRKSHTKIDIGVDGGITVSNASSAAKAGANILAAASALFTANNPALAIGRLSAIASEAVAVEVEQV